MNEFIARNGLIAQNNSTISGSLTSTGGITGSLFGTSSYSSAGSGSFTGSFSGSFVGDGSGLTGFPSVQTVVSAATVTPTSANDLVTITAQAVGLTIANPTGTMVEGQALMIRIKDNATAQTIAFDTNYRAIGVTLPTTTTISKTIYLGCIWNNTDTKFDVLGVNIQA